jgi:hypothetical protein
MVIWEIDIAACPQKTLHQLDLADGSSQMERGGTCGIQGIGRSAMGQEQIQQFQIAKECRFMKQSHSLSIDSIHIFPPLQMGQ